MFVYQTASAKFQKFPVLYESTDGNISWNKAGNTQMLPHNFQCVQLGSPAQVFMVGGGEFNMNPKSLKEMRKLIQRDGQYAFSLCADMKYQRHGHSACAVSDQYILVSGSRLEKAGAACELYNVK